MDGVEGERVVAGPILRLTSLTLLSDTSFAEYGLSRNDSIFESSQDIIQRLEWSRPIFLQPPRERRLNPTTNLYAAMNAKSVSSIRTIFTPAVKTTPVFEVETHL